MEALLHLFDWMLGRFAVRRLRCLVLYWPVDSRWLVFLFCCGIIYKTTGHISFNKTPVFLYFLLTPAEAEVCSGDSVCVNETSFAVRVK